MKHSRVFVLHVEVVCSLNLNLDQNGLNL
jgi:hypothetical protein